MLILFATVILLFQTIHASELENCAYDKPSWKVCANDEEELLSYPEPEVSQLGLLAFLGDGILPESCDQAATMGACNWSHSQSNVLYPWRGACPASCNLCDNDQQWLHFNSNPTPTSTSTPTLKTTKFIRDDFVRNKSFATTLPLLQLATAAAKAASSPYNHNFTAESVEAYLLMELRRAQTIGLNTPCWYGSCPEARRMRDRLKKSSAWTSATTSLLVECPLLHDETTGLWFGSENTHASWNVESLNMTTHHTVLSGSETWVLLPPDITPPSSDMLPSFDVDLSEEEYNSIDTSRFVIHPKNWNDRTSHLKDLHRSEIAHFAVEFSVSAGETVSVPSGWWMTWYYTEPTIALHNAVMTHSNAHAVMGELNLRGIDSQEGKCLQLLASKIPSLKEWQNVQSSDIANSDIDIHNIPNTLNTPNTEINTMAAYDFFDDEFYTTDDEEIPKETSSSSSVEETDDNNTKIWTQCQNHPELLQTFPSINHVKYESCSHVSKLQACEVRDQRSQFMYPLRKACSLSCGLCTVKDQQWKKNTPLGTKEIERVKRHHYNMKHKSNRIDRIRITSPEDEERIYRDYVSQHIPIIVEGVVEYYKWELQKYLNEALSPLNETASATSLYLREEMARTRSIGYNHYCNFQDCPSDKKIRTKLKKSYVVPWIILGGRDYIRDYCALKPRSIDDVKETKNWAHQWILIAGAGTSSAWHVDQLNTTAWNTVLKGTKRWAIARPQDYPPQISSEDKQDIPQGMRMHNGKPSSTHRYNYRSFDEASSHMIESNNHWLEEMPWSLADSPSARNQGVYFDALDNSSVHDIDDVYEFLLKKDETIIIPPGWWHAVVNIEDTVSVTENLMTNASFYMTLQEMQARPAGSLPHWCAEKLKEKFPELISPVNSAPIQQQQRLIGRLARQIKETNKKLRRMEKRLEALEHGRK